MGAYWRGGACDASPVRVVCLPFLVTHLTPTCTDKIVDTSVCQLCDQTRQPRETLILYRCSLCVWCGVPCVSFLLMRGLIREGLTFKIIIFFEGRSSYTTRAALSEEEYDFEGQFPLSAFYDHTIVETSKCGSTYVDIIPPTPHAFLLDIPDVSVLTVVANV